ncbi:eukaryotic type KH-domain (KH-domain type I) [Tilletiaria anomala UBC 951]|uniref:Pre-rRNA-processing protein PNO1 n=1 Tax=Tilletiaria anomala (strain ATCC 24038 / CBS 436.72 / UBC 951) TaxID=1037660 RepID=A0A066WEY9_TILAU|nr:eukaryotic type KH-domain (KH-domain type I) [Tilletiaria anomala UBC 951]KDN52522.1 eukaryotic type KH-domain (KH-domain type I) [Tilletiaria anomala UBC 951]
MADAGFTPVSRRKSKGKGNQPSASTENPIAKIKKGKAAEKVDAELLDERDHLGAGAEEDEKEDGNDDDLMLDDGLAHASASSSSASASAVQPPAASASSAPIAGDGEMDVDVPKFAPISKAAQAAATQQAQVTNGQLRKIPIPPHRMTPLKNDWAKIFSPLVEMAGLQVRMNVKRRMVEIKASKHTKEVGMLQKGADFVKAFALGFEADDAIALLRMDDLFVDTFEIKDVKTLHGDHLARAIGRIAGKDGRTRFAIENASRTRVVLADTKIHILGSFQNIKIARDAVVALIMGSPPGKVYNNLKVISARQRQRA